MQTGNLLVTSFFVRGPTARWITPLGRASWSEDAVLTRGRLRRSMSHVPWRKGAILVLRGWRRSVSHVAHGWRRARQRVGRRRGAPCGADELGDAVEPLLVEVVDGAVVQELTCQEQRGLRVRGSATSVGR